MAILFWDSSALAKRYIPEVGSETVAALFDSVDVSANVIALPAFAEVHSVLRNSINWATFDSAIDTLADDWFLTRNFSLISTSDTTFWGGVSFIDQFNINASDAAIFHAYIAANTADSPCFVSADKNFLRAAKSVGTAVIDPSTISMHELLALVYE